jgi:uncharacterized membrane protein YccC
MKVKIISHTHAGYSVDHDVNWVMRDCTHWDEVTEEEFKLLTKWVAMTNRDQYDVQYVIYRQQDLNVQERVQQYLDRIAAEERAADEKRKKREAAKRAKELAKKQLKESEELARYNELKKKFEGAG